MYTTTQDVYSLIGVNEEAIPEPIIEEYIKQADAEVERIIKTTCKPEIIVEKFAGNWEDTYLLKKTPLLNILNLVIDDTEVSTKYVDIKQTGEAHLTNEAEVNKWNGNTNACRVVYTRGRLEEDKDVPQELTSELDVGPNTISVTDSTQYEVGEWVKIEGIDGNYEVVKILTSTSNEIGVITTQEHTENSILTKMKVPQIVRNLAAILAAIKGLCFMIGNTYTFATSYSMPDYSVTKGVPYPHFNRNLEQNISQRDYLIRQLIPEAVFA